MSDWNHEGLPPYGTHAQAWMRDGSVRMVRRDGIGEGSGLWFTDCTHPLSNAYCHPEHVVAWRIPENEPQQADAPQYCYSDPWGVSPILTALFG